MDISTSISVNEARELVRQNVKPGGIVKVLPDQAVGRVLASDLYSDIDVTPFDDSAMDGFCLRSADIAAASADTPVNLTCVAHIGAGSH